MVHRVHLSCPHISPYTTVSLPPTSPHTPSSRYRVLSFPPIVLPPARRVAAPVLQVRAFYYVGSNDTRLAYSDGTHLNVMAYM
eukprot:scaffold14987_cov84-Isochrysis_galbana.AAC.1